MSYKQAVIIGVLLGLTAALVVWYLERFEVGRLHTEVRSYLERYDEFREWAAKRGESS